MFATCGAHLSRGPGRRACAGLQAIGTSKRVANIRHGCIETAVQVTSSCVIDGRPVLLHDLIARNKFCTPIVQEVAYGSQPRRKTGEVFLKQVPSSYGAPPLTRVSEETRNDGLLLLRANLLGMARLRRRAVDDVIRAQAVSGKPP